jgi:hypothetical protein
MAAISKYPTKLRNTLVDCMCDYYGESSFSTRKERSYRDFSRTEPLADDIKKIKHEIGQIDTKITRRREIVLSLGIGSIIGSVVTAVITKLCDSHRLFQFSDL